MASSYRGNGTASGLNNPAFAWLLIFLPTLGYFMSTRLSGVWTELGQEVTADAVSNPHLLLRLGNESQQACLMLAETFYLSGSCTSAPTKDSNDSNDKPKLPTFVELKYPLRLVQDTGLDGVVDILWRHDSDMGRGYLLLSTSSPRQGGRIWRWEVGGGPIAIGKTLHVDQSGCRSGLYKQCITTSSSSLSSSSMSNEHESPHQPHKQSLGSGALAIDFYRHGNPSTHSSEGHLMVAEWGEGRIVRLEETTGARTPLALHVPSFHCRNVCRATSTNENNGTSADIDGAAPTDSCWKRMPNIERMLLTPTGDLLLAVNHDDDEASVGDNAGECYSNCAIIPDSGGSDGANDDDSHAASATPSLSGHSASTALLVVLSNAVHGAPMASLHESRQAHAWTEIPNGTHPTTTSSRILYSDASVMRIGGIVFNSTTSSVYMTAMRRQQLGTENRTSIVLLEYPLLEDSDEGEDDDDDDGIANEKSVRPKDPVQARTLVDLDVYAPGLQRPGALVVAQSGRMFVSVHDGVLIVDQSFGVLGKVLVPLDEPPTALSLGGDGYLYIASKSRLYRIRTREQIATHETNRVRAPPKHGTTTPANR